MNNYYQNYMQKNGIVWVNGLEGARAYQLPPNSNALLLDSENDGLFYIKTSDNVGMCNIRVFKYEEIVQPTKSDYVTKDDFNKAIEELKEMMENGKQTVQPIKQQQRQPVQQSVQSNKSQQ